MEWGPGGKASWQMGAKRRPWGDGGDNGAEGLGRAEDLRIRAGGLELQSPRLGGAEWSQPSRPPSWAPSGHPSAGPGPAGSRGLHPGPQLNQGSSQTVVRSLAPGLPGTFSVTIRDLLDKP